MSSLPSGTVTFLFTDIEGSTRLARRNSTAWETARARHQAILQTAVDEHRGYVFQISGDGFCVAFHHARDALQAAAAAQQALQAEPWGDAVIRLRMGLHTGDAEARDGGYHGYLTLAHLRAIYGKLGVTTRSAATRYALEHYLV